MPQAVAAETRKPAAVPELIKNPKAAFQALETGARGRLKDLTESGNARLTAIDEMLGRVSKEDWSFTGIRRKVNALLDQAQSARASAVKRLDAMPGLAIAALAAAGRARIHDVSRGLRWLLAQIEPAPAGKVMDLPHGANSREA
jgi:hypothetical protein